MPARFLSLVDIDQRVHHRDRRVPRRHGEGDQFSVAPSAEPALAVDGDKKMLAAVLVNLVQNAIKFSHPQRHVVLGARASADRVQLDVMDECGGLPPGSAESLFRPFEQRSKDRSGVGLGLVIARRGVEAHGGELHVRDIPGTGCVFTVDLPRVP